jgi:hypothetical protein
MLVYKKPYLFKIYNNRIDRRKISDWANPYDTIKRLSLRLNTVYSVHSTVYIYRFAALVHPVYGITTTRGNDGL